ncbi:UbiA family prenyltransferase [Ketobacter sp.]|uniref:UbiA family prenyltransferase n=1 Tax=Ketobacter sp. TaxID=2083498 RepID=UPI000F2CCFB3|nr:UbiA family prenyltransferase [Ketobacter sp.]RLT98642.1 MAG: UbiA family prenyltransferase [Ketobacter sp.]
MSDSNKKPLVVDLDGTLIKTDLLLESFMLLMRANPFLLFLVLVWVCKGKSYLKQQIAQRVEIPVQFLPYSADLLDYLKSQKQQGRELVLATASHERYATAIADHLQLFDHVLATNESVNLSGAHKREALIKRYGEGGFVYAGNASVDLNVWSHSAAAVVVGSDNLVASASRQCSIEASFVQKPPSIKTFIKALRVHQWVKNGLVFVPLLTAHQMQDPKLLLMSVLGFIAFSVCASSVYFLNDLLDLFDDRQHATKCNRPFAAGTLSLLVGILGTPLLLLTAVVASWFLPTQFQIVLAVYYVLTLAYSFKLKRLVMVDVVTLASLYTIRIVAGAAAISVLLSFWLLSFSIFVFLSLAIIKRYTELMKLKAKSASKALGRGYQVEDLELLSSLGGASGYLSVLVLALYINSPDVKSMYSDPVLMWPACLVMLYWVSRIWIIAHRGNMEDDPIVFALKDRASLVCGALIAGFMFMAV